MPGGDIGAKSLKYFADDSIQAGAVSARNGAGLNSQGASAATEIRYGWRVQRIRELVGFDNVGYIDTSQTVPGQAEAGLCPGLRRIIEMDLSAGANVA